jgi:hypothetical protein
MAWISIAAAMQKHRMDSSHKGNVGLKKPQLDE